MCLQFVEQVESLTSFSFAVAMTFDPSVVSKYNVGYQECAHEVDRYLGTIDGLSPEVRMRLMHHLGNSYNCANDAAMTSSFQYRAAAAALSLPFPLPSATAESSLPGSCLRSALPAQLCNMVDLSRAMAAEFRRSPSLAEDLSARPASAGSGSDCKNNDMNLDSLNNNNADAIDLNRRDCKPYCDKAENNNVELNRHESSKVTGHSSPGGHSPLLPLGVVKQEQVWRPWWLWREIFKCSTCI